MKKRYIVNLTPEEREGLTQLVKRERVSGLKRQRASILLKADDHLTDQEIADDLEVGLVTVERVRRHCIKFGIEACLDRKAQDNPSRRRKRDGAAEAQLTQIACSEPPKGRSRWTLSLLVSRRPALRCSTAQRRRIVGGRRTPRAPTTRRRVR